MLKFIEKLMEMHEDDLNDNKCMPLEKQGLKEANDLQLLISTVRSASLKDSLFYQRTKFQELESILKRIRDRLDEMPDTQIRPQFKTYYIKTSKELLDTYQKLDRQSTLSSTEVENINKMKKEIKHLVPEMIRYFAKYLNALYQDQYLDVSSDAELVQMISNNDQSIDRSRD